MKYHFVYKFILPITFLISMDSFGQNPGNVSDNFKLWVKANEGTDALLTNDPVTIWNDNSPLSLNLAQTSLSHQPQFVEDNINYNPSVEFDGVNDFLSNDLTGESFTSEFSILMVTRMMSPVPEGAIFHNHTTGIGNGDLTSFQIDGNGTTYRYRNNSDLSGSNLETRSFQ